MKSRLILSCAAAAVTIGAAGNAQARSTIAKASAGTPVPATDTAGGDIVITAQRRRENLRDVPLTVQAFTGDTLARMNVPGGFMDRYIAQQLDYANYSRTAGGMYYQCTGGSTGWGSGTPRCYSPAVYWHDRLRNTHLSNEVRLSTPGDWRVRGTVSAFQESFRIDDVMISATLADALGDARTRYRR